MGPRMLLLLLSSHFWLLLLADRVRNGRQRAPKIIGTVFVTTPAPSLFRCPRDCQRRGGGGVRSKCECGGFTFSELVHQGDEERGPFRELIIKHR